MQRYFTEETLIAGEVYVSGSDTHHMKNVMRFREGQAFHMVDRTRTAFLCEVVDVDDSVHFKVMSKIDESPELPVEISVFCPLLKGEKFEWMIQKSTELGAFDFNIFDAERSVVKLDEKKRSKRLTRYEKVIKEAGEQSRRNLIPEIHFAGTLKDIDFNAFDAVLFAYEGNVNKPAASMNQVLETLKKNSRIAFVFGPEGGFSDVETDLMDAYHSVRLGARILRAETAPLYALAAISYRFEQPATR
ncbi:RsmE family RNA methyltransferase [Salinicoccus sp. HZC-1]|uniref:RsmE family RNA methyltransferase n=1 Tax=Salinicoccus sp. HZC-1 TaxID=3385497 RepID=UPI00398BAE61